MEAENISIITEPTKAIVKFVDGASKCGTIYKDKKALEVGKGEVIYTKLKMTSPVDSAEGHFHAISFAAGR